MAQVRDGSVAAFQALYERHHRALFNFLVRLLADRPRAEDLVQEAFLRAFLHRETYRPTAAFRTWLTRERVSSSEPTSWRMMLER